MICTIEKKFCATGNRTEFTYHKFIVIDRVMIQNVIFFKIARVVYKIVIH